MKEVILFIVPLILGSIFGYCLRGKIDEVRLDSERRVKKAKRKLYFYGRMKATPFEYQKKEYEQRKKRKHLKYKNEKGGKRCA